MYSGEGRGWACAVAESPTHGFSCLSLLRWLLFPVLLRIGWWESEAHCGGDRRPLLNSHAVESVRQPAPGGGKCLSLSTTNGAVPPFTVALLSLGALLLLDPLSTGRGSPTPPLSWAPGFGERRPPLFYLFSLFFFDCIRGTELNRGGCLTRPATEFLSTGL